MSMLFRELVRGHPEDETQVSKSRLILLENEFLEDNLASGLLVIKWNNNSILLILQR